MIRNGFLLVGIIIAASSCGFFKSKEPPPPPEPTLAVIKVEAAADINPNDQGRPSPLMLRIYQLKYFDAFEDADYISLYDKDQEVLEGEYIAKKEVLLKPGTKDTIFLEDVSERTGTIGFMGLFRDEDAQWKAAEGIQQHKTTVIHVYVSGTKLTSRLQVNPAAQE